MKLYLFTEEFYPPLLTEIKSILDEEKTTLVTVTFAGCEGNGISGKV